jgi:S1-C subfamily serine protease
MRGNRASLKAIKLDEAATGRITMIRKWTMLMAVIVTAAMAASARAQVERSAWFSDEFQWKAIEHTVRIRTEIGKKVYQGTGVCVAYRDGTSIILTAAHVVKGAKWVTIEVFTRQSYPKPCRTFNPSGKVWRNDRDDIAILSVRARIPLAVRVVEDAESIPNGCHVFSVGCGSGAPPVVQVAVLSKDNPDGDYTVDRGGTGGRSGGPLFCSRGFIGICSRGLNDEETFVSLPKIQRYVSRVVESQRDEE